MAPRKRPSSSSTSSPSSRRGRARSLHPTLDKKGLKLIGFIAAGYRGIYGHYPINSIADVKGKKIRVQEDKILVATFKALGMISTPIAFPEVATSLQTKVIDSAEGGSKTFYHKQFSDI